MDAYGVQENCGELAYLGQEVYKVDSAKQQAKPKLAIQVPEKKNKSRSESINEHCKQLGHPNLVATKSMSNARDVSLTGTAEVCNDCSVGKARQKKCAQSHCQKENVY